jgi:hypothetical protein
MKTFLIGDGQTDETIQANDIEEAKSLAEDWIREGSWDNKCEVDGQVVEINDDKEVVNREWITVEVGEDPPEPECEAVNSRKKTPARILADLWTNNGFGEVDEWEKLDRADLVRECKELLGHWSSNGWDLGSTTALDVVDFLEDEWSKGRRGG